MRARLVESFSGITDDGGELVTGGGAAVSFPSGEGQVEDGGAGGDLFLDLSLGWERAGWFAHEQVHPGAVGEPPMSEGVVVARLSSPRSCGTCVPRKYGAVAAWSGGEGEEMVGP